VGKGFSPAPEHESPAAGQLCGAQHTPGWPRSTARALWGNLPVCGVHLNAKRGSHWAAVRLKARNEARHAAAVAARIAVEALAKLGVAAVPSLERDGVTIALEDIHDLTERLARLEDLLK
jgi:hypothetical protein